MDTTPSSEQSVSGLSALTRRAHRLMLTSTSRSELESRLCQLFAESDAINLAWIGIYDASEQTISAQSIAAHTDTDIDVNTVVVDCSAYTESATVAAVSTKEIQIRTDLSSDPIIGDYINGALASNVSSVAAIPLEIEDVLFGVFTLYATDPGIFEAQENLLSILGADISFTIRALRDRSALEKSEARLTLALESAHAGVWEATLETGKVQWDDRLIDIYGPEPEDIEAFEERIHPDDRNTVIPAIEAALEGGGTFQQEFRLENGAGEYRWILAVGSVLRDLKETPTRVVGVGIDISERKARKTQLERERRKFETLTESLGEVVYRTDPETLEPIYVNQAVQDFFGQPPEKWLQRSNRWYDSIHPEDRERVRSSVTRLKEKHEEGVLEYRLLSQDGSVRWVEDRLSWEIDDEGVIVAQVGVIYDITPRKERDQHLQVIDRVLRHNLRNDLNIITGTAKEIGRGCTEDHDALIDRIVTQSGHLLETADKERDIVEVLLDRPAIVEMDLQRTIERIVESMKETYPAAEFSIESQTTHMVAVADNFPKAIEELIENAIIHNDSERPMLKVSITALGDDIRIQVIDNGPTIPSMNIDVLKEGGEVDPLYHGSGLGLWLVNWIVNRSGGALSFSERQPRGNIIQIDIPEP